MLHDRPKWKANWDQTYEHYQRWWNHEGPVLALSGLPELDEPRSDASPPPEPQTARQRHTDPDWFAMNERYRLARAEFPADNLPLAHTEYGCVQLAACLGAEPDFADGTVWYSDCIRNPEESLPLVLMKSEPWWQAYKRTMLKVKELSQGDFLVGMPAFGSNLDVLAELRGTQNLLFDMTDRPDWVKHKLQEINEAFFVAYDDYYQEIRLSNGSSGFSYFHLWGPGRVSQVQCDFSAMISPEMFSEFVLPPLQRQCSWLDHSLFHLDGPNCIRHLEHLLAIPELDAVQWTPGAAEPGAGNAKWYGLYEQILNAGKSVQILGASIQEARDILNTFGGKGVYLSVCVSSEREADDMTMLIETFR